MKIATWNVNSLRVRLPQVIEWLAQQPVDILGLQELKLAHEHFPIDALTEAGWQAEWQGQPTYNGVALISSCIATEVQGNLPNFEDPQQRVIAATYTTNAGPLRVINAYCPNGQDLSSDKFLYKLSWYEAFHSWLAEQLVLYPLLVVMGDYNIAPTDADVHDPKAWEGKVHVSPQERAAFQKLLDLGLHDAFRLFEQEEKSYTWWDYRSMAFRRNAGLRIDHVLVSTALLPHTTACFIDKSPRRNERPSDHTPCVVELNLLPQS